MFYCLFQTVIPHTVLVWRCDSKGRTPMTRHQSIPPKFDFRSRIETVTDATTRVPRYMLTFHTVSDQTDTDIRLTEQSRFRLTPTIISAASKKTSADWSRDLLTLDHRTQLGRRRKPRHFYAGKNSSIIYQSNDAEVHVIDVTVFSQKDIYNSVSSVLLANF